MSLQRLQVGPGALSNPTMMLITSGLDLYVLDLSRHHLSLATPSIKSPDL